jgi:steroid delta-isomerase-like uncharacterized protein
VDHSTTMRNAYDRINAGDVAGFADLMAEDFVEHEDTPGFAPTKDGTIEFFHMLRSAFPDMHMHVEDIIEGGDKAVARVRVTGTQQGDFLGMPASGKSADVAVIDIMRFDDAGLVAEHWGVMDMLGLLQQLGVIPAGPA